MSDRLQETYYEYDVELFLCVPVGYRELKTKDSVKFHAIVNGCGAGSSLIDFVPDTVWGLSVKEACNIHDYSWYVCPGTEEEFHRWNQIFLNNMCRIIDYETSWPWLRKLRKLRAKKYYKAVETFGASVFWDLKRV